MPPPHCTPLLTAVYFPGLNDYFKLVEDLSSNTRLRWGATCLHQHPGWQHVFWDLAAARELVQTVRARRCCFGYLVARGRVHWRSSGGLRGSPPLCTFGLHRFALPAGTMRRHVIE